MIIFHSESTPGGSRFLQSNQRIIIFPTSYSLFDIDKGLNSILSFLGGRNSWSVCTGLRVLIWVCGGNARDW